MLPYFGRYLVSYGQRGNCPHKAAAQVSLMTDALKIQKGLSTEILATMADGQDICGRFYLADHAQSHYGQETMLDVLNRVGQPFVPFLMDDQQTVVLIQKSRIIGLRPSADESLVGLPTFDEDEKYWPPAQIYLAGKPLDGHAYTGDLQPEKRRLTDLLNDPAPFFRFETESGSWIINKNRLNFLVPQS